MAELACVICLYVRTGTAEAAVTVVEGYAVCDDHLPYVARGPVFLIAMADARREEQIGTQEAE